MSVASACPVPGEAVPSWPSGTWASICGFKFNLATGRLAITSFAQMKPSVGTQCEVDQKKLLRLKSWQGLTELTPLSSGVGCARTPGPCGDKRSHPSQLGSVPFGRGGGGWEWDMGGRAPWSLAL